MSVEHGALSFRLVTQADLPLLHEWLARPHVAEWWSPTPSLAELERDYGPQAIAQSSTRPYIALADGQPIGFIQSYVAMGSGEGWWPDEQDPGVRGIDQFLAHAEQLGRGLGTAMVRAFVEQLFADPEVTRVQTDPSPANRRAIRAYEKAGFRALGEVDTPDGPALLMIRDRPKRAGALAQSAMTSPRSSSYDAIVVGSGPNGLSAAIELARAGWSVLVLEAAPVIGGGMRSEELTRPGFVHDVCSSVHPLAVASPFFRSLPLAGHGLEWVMPPAAMAHPLDGGSAAMLERSTEVTGRTIGEDAGRYRALMEPLVEHWTELLPELLAPLRFPRHPVLMARFGLRALRSASGLATSSFRGELARALFAGNSAHSMIPLTAAGSAAFGLVMALSAHGDGWPFVRGGTRGLAAALASYLRSLGGQIVTGTPVRSLAELPPARAVLLDLTPRQVLQVAGNRLPGRYRAALERYRYGPGVCKVDWALAEPIPWRAGECARAGTVHLGGTLAEVVAAEEAPWRGRHSERPFVLLSQPTLFDPGRAPPGKHIAWAYCHVPHGADVDMTVHIEAQVERFAPGFRDVILARSTLTPSMLERHDANLVGGDVGGGANTLDQIVFRPTVRRVPYTTPVPGLFLCSASTPPGGGVHGMCGYHAARAVLASVRRA